MHKNYLLKSFWPWQGPNNGSELGFNVKNYGYIGDGTELVTTNVNQLTNPNGLSRQKFPSGHGIPLSPRALII